MSDQPEHVHDRPVVNAGDSGPAYNAVRIRQLLSDGCGTISLYRTTVDGGALEVGRARNARDKRFDVELLGPFERSDGTIVRGYAKHINNLTWSLWRDDGHWVGYASTLAFAADVLSNGYPDATSANRMYRGALTLEHGET